MEGEDWGRIYLQVSEKKVRARELSTGDMGQMVNSFTKPVPKINSCLQDLFPFSAFHFSIISFLFKRKCAVFLNTDKSTEPGSKRSLWKKAARLCAVSLLRQLPFRQCTLNCLAWSNLKSPKIQGSRYFPWENWGETWEESSITERAVAKRENNLFSSFMVDMNLNRSQKDSS